MSDDDEKSIVHQGPDHAAPYPVSRLAPAFGLVDMALEIEKADRMVTAVVSAELRVIADEIKSLQEKARAVLARAQRDAELHRAECRFKKQAGGVYHLYERGDGGRYFSMLSPAEWRGAPPHRFVGSYRLEIDSGFSEV